MKLKKKLFLLTVIISSFFILCAFQQPQQPEQPVYDLTTINEWLTIDVWNDGLCTFDWYMKTGLDSNGSTYDSAFGLQRFKINIMDIALYDYYIASLPNDGTYAVLKYDWAFLKTEILKNYNAVVNYQVLPVDGIGLDLGLLEQYDNAFKIDLAALGY